MKELPIHRDRENGLAALGIEYHNRWVAASTSFGGNNGSSGAAGWSNGTRDLCQGLGLPKVVLAANFLLLISELSKSGPNQFSSS
jgi:hypothetical protein